MDFIDVLFDRERYPLRMPLFMQPASDAVSRRCALSGVGHQAREGHVRVTHNDNRQRTGVDGKPDVLVHYVIDGEGWFADEQQEYPVRAGVGFICIKPSATAYGLHQEHYMDWFWFNFSGVLAVELAEEYIRDRGHLLELPAHSPVLAELFELYRNQVQGLRASAADLSALAFKFFAELQVAGQGQQTVSRFIAAQRWVEEHLHEVDLDVVSMARAIGMTRSHFTRQFTASFQESPHAYVARRRLQRAAELLRYHEANVTDIARQCGFRSVAWFCTAFKRHYGVTPVSYRSS